MTSNLGNTEAELPRSTVKLTERLRLISGEVVVETSNCQPLQVLTSYKMTSDFIPNPNLDRFDLSRHSSLNTTISWLKVGKLSKLGRR